jgi:hypothetical protein
MDPRDIGADKENAPLIGNRKPDVKGLTSHFTELFQRMIVQKMNI